MENAGLNQQEVDNRLTEILDKIKERGFKCEVRPFKIGLYSAYDIVLTAKKYGEELKDTLTYFSGGAGTVLDSDLDELDVDSQEFYDMCQLDVDTCLDHFSKKWQNILEAVKRVRAKNKSNVVFGKAIIKGHFIAGNYYSNSTVIFEFN